MPDDVVIKVENLSKRYRLGELHKQTNSFREKITQSFNRTLRSIRGFLNPFNHSTPSTFSTTSTSSSSAPNALHPARPVVPVERTGPFNTVQSSQDETIWALRNVSFQVKRGEIVGIIGRNGAGKTTLLKILSRITKPTEGRAWINGRVGSLLEVGTGFHAELTGRENIFLNGAILGMTKTEIRQKFDEIVDFAEIEKFIDTPVKRYSSGMYVRLAFAVAAHLDPEILLVDEVLAVGDTAFQKKCIGKIGKVAKKGRTVLFVSHNMASIQKICNTVIYISNGRIIESGEPSYIISNYLHENLSADSNVDFPNQIHNHKSHLQIQSVEVLNSSYQPSNVILYGEEINIRLGIATTEFVSKAKIGIGIHTQGIRISTVHTPAINIPQSSDKKYVTCKIPGVTLNPGIYNLHLGAHSVETGRALDWIPDAVSFTVSPVNCENSKVYDEKDKGFVMLNVVWDSDLL